MGKRTAVLFVTHIITNGILKEFDRISNGTDRIYDAYFLYDKKNTNIPEEIKEYRYFSFNKEEISKLNYPILDEQRIADVPMKNALHLANYQFAVLKFFLHNPDYDFYWFIEYDVRYSGKWLEFFNYFNGEQDFITSYLRTYDDEPKWKLWYLNHPERTITEMERIRSFNPVMRISNKALDFLHRSLLDGWIGHTEVLIPTLLYKNGFYIEDMGGSGKFCKKENIEKNYIGSKNNIYGSLDKGTMRYRPHIFYFGLRKNKLYHPVKPLKSIIEYYKRRFARFIRNNF